MFKSNRIKAPQAELFSFIFPVNELSLDSALLFIFVGVERTEGDEEGPKPGRRGSRGVGRGHRMRS